MLSPRRHVTPSLLGLTLLFSTTVYAAEKSPARHALEYAHRYIACVYERNQSVPIKTKEQLGRTAHSDCAKYREEYLQLFPGGTFFDEVDTLLEQKILREGAK